jgi:hypothetical protein
MNKYYADTSKEGVDVIVFSIDDNSYINMTTASYDKLIQLIKPHNFPVIKSDQNNLPYVSLGPPSTSDNTNSDIYIDCKPISEDGKIIGGNNSNSIFKSTNIDKVVTSSWFKIGVPVFFGILILYFIAKLMINFNIKDAILAAKENIKSKKIAPVSVAPSVSATSVIKGGKSIVNAMKKNKLK